MEWIIQYRKYLIEICYRQYGGTVEQWDRYRGEYLEEVAARALRDAEDQARKENARREGERIEARRLNIEIFARQYGAVVALGLGYLPDEDIARWATKALWSAEAEAFAEERRRNIEICARHFGEVSAAWGFYPSETIARCARVALDQAWDMAHAEDVKRTPLKQRERRGWVFY